MQADSKNPLCIRFHAIRAVQILLDLGMVDAQEFVRSSGVIKLFVDNFNKLYIIFLARPIFSII